MKKICKSMTLVLGMICCIMLCGFTGVLAANGPAEDDDSYAFIKVGQEVVGKTEYGYDKYCNHYVYLSDYLKKEKDANIDSNPYEMVSDKKVKYDKKTNTLTLNNFSGDGITVNMMGDDFKIELIGENNLEMLYVYTDYYGNNLTLTGKGTLNISGGNYDSEWAEGETGLKLFCESGEAKTALTVEKGATLHIVGSGRYSYPLIGVYRTNEKKNGIVLDGVKLKGSFISKTDMELYEMENSFYVCIKGGKEYYYDSKYQRDNDTGLYSETINVYKKDNTSKPVKTFSDRDSFYGAGYKNKERTAYTYVICGKECTISAKADTTPGKGDLIQKGDLWYGILTTGTKKKAGSVICAGLNNWKREAPKTVEIPKTIKVNGITYKVTAVSDEAFMYKSGIETLIIGENVKNIGKSAFAEISSLTEIIIKTKKLKTSTVKKDAFKLYSDNITVQVPSGKAASYKKLLQAKGLNVKATVK